MLISGTANLTMLGGVVPHGDAGSSIILMNSAMLVVPDPNVHVGGQQTLWTGMMIAPQANVIHSGEVSINDPNQP